MDQELGLILDKSDAKQMFITEWSTKFVPAIISYGEKLGKPAIISARQANMITIIDDTSHQVTALKVLARSFAYRRSFMHEEYDVSL